MATKWLDVDSEFILKVGYDEERQELDIIFYEGEKVDGYTYFDFNKEKFDEFIAASSQGEYFNDSIRPVYRYTK